MIKTKRFLLTLLVVLMCISLAFTAFACKDDTPTPEEEEQVDTEQELFTNGNFTQTSSESTDEYPHVPSSWTGTPGSTSSSSSLKTPQGNEDLQSGIIDITKADAALGGSPNKPNPETNKDNKVLMINNKTHTSYRYVSGNVTLAKDKFYKLSLFVKTTNIDNKNGVGGAYVQVTGNAYASFENIDTKGEWKEYTVYFRSSNATDYTIQLSLGLGTGNLETGLMTKGFAYFDLVTLTNLTDVEEGQEAFTVEKFNAIQRSAVQEKCDMRTIDSKFDYASSVTSLPYTPAQLTGKGGTGSGNAASVGSSYTEKGIMDISMASGTYSFSALGSAPYTLVKNPNSIGDRMLYVHNKQLTAYGYKDNLGLFIDKNSYYEISVYVKTEITDGTGAAVRLVTTSNEVLSEIKGINTASGWEKFTFYVEGNAYSSNTLYIEMWLGTGGSGDGDWAKGVAFFDDLSYEEIEKSVYDSKKAEIDASTLDNAQAYSYAKAEGAEIAITDTLFKSTQYEESFLNGNELKYSKISLEDIDIFGTAQKALVAENTRASALSLSTFYKVADSDTVDTTNKDIIKILPNTAYELSFWVKTVDIDSTKSVTLDIVSFDEDKKDDFDSAISSIVTISSINSESLESFKDENRDGYTRYTVYLLGAEKDITYAGIKITMGTGATSTQSSGFVSGKFYLSNIRLQTVEYSTYSSIATSTVIHKKSLGGSGASSEVSSNATFTFIDIPTTNTTYKDKLDTIWDADNNLIGTAVPQNWTITNSTYLATSTAGVINVNNYDLASIDASLNKTNIYAGMPSDITIEDYPNVLYISKDDQTPYLGYTSNTITLNANSYYLISVFARCIDGSFTIDVTPSSYKDPDKTAMTYTKDQVGDGWKEYMCMIKTGVTSTSVKVSLTVGSPGNTLATAKGKVLFTMAYYTSNVTKEQYEAVEKAKVDTTSTSIDLAINRTKLQSWDTDTMDTTSTSFTDKLNTPSNWTGSAVDSASSTGDDDVAKGVFDRTNSDWSTIDIDPDATDSFGNTLYDETKEVGDSVLVIYNKTASTYSYSCSSFTLNAGSYYKVSIDVLTKDLKYLTKEETDKDTEKYKDWEDKNLYETATITLTINNKNYSFGKDVQKDKKAEDFTGDKAAEAFSDYQIDAQRIVNVNEWTTYTFYIALDEEIDTTVSCSLKLSLGGKNISYWATGYLFIDNFQLKEMKEVDFKGADGVDPTVPSAESLNKDNALTKTTYRIDFTNEDAQAEAEVEEEETEQTEPQAGKDFLWLYITSGIIGGLIVIVLIVFIVKKYAPKKKKIKKSKKTTTASDSTRNKFGD